MIETTQSVSVRVGIEHVWDYVKDIRRWAELMPGLQECEIIDNDDSRWVLKVGVGALVRTVKVLVHVDQWDGPERVYFSFKLQGDPVTGGGSYLATRQGPQQTEMTFAVRVQGGGPMAPMWEAMAGPLMPKFALSFAEQLRDGIEEAAGVSAEAARERPQAAALLAAAVRWLRNAWRRLFASSPR